MVCAPHVHGQARPRDVRADKGAQLAREARVWFERVEQARAIGRVEYRGERDDVEGVVEGEDGVRDGTKDGGHLARGLDLPAGED